MFDAAREIIFYKLALDETPMYSPLEKDSRGRSAVPKCLISLALLASVCEAQAASIVITPSYVQSFDSAYSSLGKLPNDGAATPVGSYMQFEFRMSLLDAAPGEDFWIAIFNLNLGPGLKNESGWLDPASAQLNLYYPALPSLGQYDSNGAAVGGIEYHWQFGNNDFGVDPDDLQSIIVEADSVEAANRQYGEAARPSAGDVDALGLPTLIGTLVVQRTELVPTLITVSPIAGSPWGMYVGNDLGNGDFRVEPASRFTGQTVRIAVPEPTTYSLSLLTATFMTIWATRRRGAH